MLKNISRDIYINLEKIQIYSGNPLLKDTLLKSNQDFEKLDDINAYIDQRDGEWRSVPKDETTPFMQRLIRNNLSNNLREKFIEFYKRQYGYSLFWEVFVTNKYGANVAQTQKTTDYRQDDEKWWQAARAKGLYVSDIGYDESTGAQVIKVAASIHDEAGDFIGAIKGTVSSRELIRWAEITTTGKHETAGVELISEDGKLIYATEAFKFLEDISENDFFKEIKGETGFFIAQEGGRDKLFSYAHSTGFGEFKGLPWILVLEHDVEEILAPAFSLRNNIIFASLVLVGLGLIVALFLSRTITVPLENLRRGVERIGKGDMEHRVPVETGDEIGELAGAFNEMADKRLQAEEDLRKHRDHLEELVEERAAELKRSNEELEQFAYVASHDLQEPIRMVSSYTQLLEKRYKDHLDQDARDFIYFAVDGSKRMQRLINDLVSYSRVSTRGGELELVDFNSALGEARADLKAAIEETQALVTNDELPTLIADKSQMIRLFQNLIGNALKFQGGDPTRVHVSAQEKADHWVFSVSDNGVGIDPEYHERIFTIFQRLKGGEEYQGTGIGLAICKRIVNRHGGDIRVESQPGEGSTFYFTIPKRGGKQS